MPSTYRKAGRRATIPTQYVYEDRNPDMRDFGEMTPPTGQGTLAGSTISSYRWAIVGVMVAGNWSMTITSLALGLLLPSISVSLNLSDLQGGWLGSSLRLGNVVMALPAAMLLSQANPIRISTISMFLASAFTFLHGLAPSYLVLLIARIGFGLTFTMRVPARALLVQQWFPLKEVPLVNGLVVGLTGIAEAFALIMTPVILSLTGSWRDTYFIYGVVTAAAFLVWVLFARERSTPEFQERIRSEPGLPYRALFRYKEIWMIGLASAGATFGWFAFATFWPTYMLETNDVSLTRSGFLFSLISIAMIPSSMAVGFMASRVGRRREILAACGILMTAGFIGMIATTQMWALVIFAIMGGVAWSFTPLAISIPFEISGIKPREVAVGASVVTTLMMGGGVLGPVTTGAISDATGSLSTALLVCALTPLTLVLFSAFLREGSIAPVKPS